jgi:hypothetical protein
LAPTTKLVDPKWLNDYNSAKVEAHMQLKIIINNNNTVFIILLLALVAACTSPPIQSFPDADIVFQSSDIDLTEIGFINADGSEEERVTTEFYVSRPVWSSSGTELFYIDVRGDRSIGSAGQASYWSEGERKKTCRNRQFQSVASIDILPSDLSHPVALLNNLHRELVLFDLEECKVLDKILDYSDEQSVLIWGVSTSPDGDSILYSVNFDRLSEGSKFTIKSFDLSSRTRKDIVEGINPQLSPSMTQIAYVWFDGIYIYDIELAETKRVLPYDARWSIDDTLIYQSVPPAPRWSPDGDSLIYHKCVQESRSCHDIFDYNVFILDVASGMESLLVEGGVYPYWR